MSIVSRVEPLTFPWPGSDPFLFVAHHLDAYPAGNDRMGPDPSLVRGRDVGQDFSARDGWSMYHGDVVPGFPQHPHRGVETVTIVRRGLIDHSDSLGATARFGAGDVQWLTAGKGIVHSEMFPLVHRDAPNPTELFQIWLNLPRARKLVDPYFSMLWKEAVPIVTLPDASVVVVAGRFGDATPPAPPPDSWASDPASDVAIWTIALAPGARITLPPARAGTVRWLYVHGGAGLRVGDRDIGVRQRVLLVPDREAELVNGAEPTDILLLQGRPIDEPVAQYGPFVMNTRAEIEQAFADYRRTHFGGWRWGSDGPVLPRDEGRFARYPDGTISRP